MLGYWEFVEGLTRGFAAHHAGMLPTFREIVEELFTAGRIRAVFATETLALGINMPARSVVLERLVKFNGETHADITPAEYTQLTGRAGRRGIDIEGHAVVLYNRGLDPLAVGGLASTRTYPLKSSFRPTYNMAVNLVGQVGRQTAREILETSFAQFQADRAVVGMALTVKRNEEALAGYAESMTCHLGDFTAYAALRNEIRDIEKEAAKARSASRRAEAAVSLEKLRPGDVIKIPGGRRSGYAIVIQGNAGGKKEERLADRADLGRTGAPAHAHGRPHAGRPGHQPQCPQAFQRPKCQVPQGPCGHDADQGAARPATDAAYRLWRVPGRGAGQRAASADARAPLPWLPRSREPRALGRALVAAAPGDRPCRPHGRGQDQLGRPHVRPRLRAAGGPGLPHRGRRRGDTAG